MRLRHKKPINSYKGQVSHNSSEILDEDFEKHPSSYKRIKAQKSYNSSDNVKKSAQILLEFISNMNTDYRHHISNFGSTKPRQQLFSRGPDLVEYQNNVKVHMENHSASKQLKPIKQQYNYSQNLSGIGKKQRQKGENGKKIKNDTRGIKKNQIISKGQPERKNSRNANKSVDNEQNLGTKKQIGISIQKNTKKPNNLNTAEQKKNEINIKTTQKQPPSKNQTKPQQPTIPSNFPIPNIFQLDQNTLQLAQAQYLQMQMQMMNSPQIAFLKSNQGVNIQQLQLNALYNQFGFQNNFIPISKLPFLNQNNQTSQNAPIPQKSKSVETNQQNKKTSPAFQQIQKKQKIIEKKVQPDTKKIDEQLKKDEKSKVKEEPEGPPPDFKKRASYHVAIAYNIYYLQLKKKGRIPDNIPDKREIEAIDPTFHAKKVRERKSSDFQPFHLSSHN